jgi:16S rRNA (cytosine967-C5)-methyltransferase
LKPGLAARTLALAWLRGVLEDERSLDHLLEKESSLPPRDRSFAHALTATTLRRLGEIDAALDRFLAKPLPRSAGPARMILRLGAAQLLYMRTDAHAALDLSVELAKGDVKAKHFTGLINAVLRKASMADAPSDTRLNMPDWLWRELSAAYGDTAALAIADAHATEAPLDLSPANDPVRWADTLSGLELPTGTVRLALNEMAVTELPGFSEGAWWVQDAAAALPVRLLGDVKGASILDLCAAPGGKAAQLASKGAHVTAVDDSPSRMSRMRSNLARLKLAAELIVADAVTFKGGASYDGVLLDAPCSATGTMRRHPDVGHLKSAQQVRRLVDLQAALLDCAAGHVKPGGILVYCVCSLLPAEGEAQAVSFLQRHHDFVGLPVMPGDIAGQSQFLTPNGYLRTLPHMRIGDSQGLDGFFAVRFRKAD